MAKRENNNEKSHWTRPWYTTCHLLTYVWMSEFSANEKSRQISHAIHIHIVLTGFFKSYCFSYHMGKERIYVAKGDINNESI